MAEIIVVHGYAGSGKSTQCERLVRDGFDDYSIQHISVGNRLREIRTGLATSKYADIINAPNAPSPLPDEIVSGAIFESVQSPQVDKNLVLIDGYPRHPKAVEAFNDTLRDKSCKLLGTIAMQVSMEISLDRVVSRGQRLGEKVINDDLESFAAHRYSLDQRTTTLAVEALSRFAPVETIDANANVDSVYDCFKLSIGKLILESVSESDAGH